MKKNKHKYSIINDEEQNNIEINIDNSDDVVKNSIELNLNKIEDEEIEESIDDNSEKPKHSSISYSSAVEVIVISSILFVVIPTFLWLIMSSQMK